MKLAKNKILKCATSIIVCLFCGYLGSIAVTRSLSWYRALTQPFFTPPDWIFAPVWTVLYVLMGISFYIVWYHGLENSYVKKAAVAFVIQLLLNLAWSLVFFGLTSIFGGLFIILALLIAIIYTMLCIHSISKQATLLLWPYLFWVLYAAILNYALSRLN